MEKTFSAQKHSDNELLDYKVYNLIIELMYTGVMHICRDDI
jgi:hypothetical protein